MTPRRYAGDPINPHILFVLRFDMNVGTNMSLFLGIFLDWDITVMGSFRFFCTITRGLPVFDSSTTETNMRIGRSKPLYFAQGAFIASVLLLSVGYSPYFMTAPVMGCFSLSVATGSLLATLVTCILIATGKVASRIISKRVIALAIVLMIIGLGIFIRSFFIAEKIIVLLIIGGLSFGVGEIIIIFSWGYLFARLNSRQILFYSVMALASCSFIPLICWLAEPSISLIVLSVACVAGLSVPAYQVFKEGSLGIEAVTDHEMETIRLPLRKALSTMKMISFGPLFGMALSSFTSGIFFTQTEGMAWPLFLCPIIAAACLMPFILTHYQEATPMWLYRLALPVIAAVLVCVKVLPANELSSNLFANGMLVLFCLAGILSWGFIVEMMKHAEFSPTFIVAGSQGVLSFSVLVGCAIGVIIKPDMRITVLAVADIVFFAYLAITLFWFFKHRSEEKIYLKATALDIEERCDCVSKAYELSPRESEILLYLGRGHSSPYIAKSLYISENTARSHMKNIYRKLGIKSKDELIRIVEKAE